MDVMDRLRTEVEDRLRDAETAEAPRTRMAVPRRAAIAMAIEAIEKGAKDRAARYWSNSQGN